MNLLLDTHVVLWWLNGDAMSTEAVEAIEESTTRVWLSAAVTSP
ncbi:MAG: hypothetical protein ACKVHU_03235 [Acidimicrobiales bacterium]